MKDLEKRISKIEAKHAPPELPVLWIMPGETELMARQRLGLTQTEPIDRKIIFAEVTVDN